MTPDGERVTTGSEPRRWRVGSHYGIHIYEQVGPEKSDADIPVATALTTDFARRIVEAHNRVGEPGHDEQALGQALAIERALEHERTVKAVVEALREQAPESAAYISNLGNALNYAADFVTERFNLSSEGTDG